MHQCIGVSKAVRVKLLKAVILSPCDIPRPGTHVDIIGGIFERLFQVGEIQHRASLRLDLEPDKARDDMAHVEVQSYHPAGWHVHRDWQALNRCCASDVEPRRRPNPLDRTGNRCVYLTIQSLDLYGRGCLDLAAQLGNRTEVE